MILKTFVSLFLPIAVLLSIFPTVSAIGDFTVDMYETEKEIIFSKNQTSQTIYMNGVVNYTGVSAIGDTIELSCSFELGESIISPMQMTFYITGSEEFIVELIIPNIYENGTIGGLMVQGSYQKGGVNYSYIVTVYITIINYSFTNNHILSNQENHQQNDILSGIGSIFMISIIIIIAIIVVVIYKKRY